MNKFLTISLLLFVSQCLCKYDACKFSYGDCVNCVINGCFWCEAGVGFCTSSNTTCSSSYSTTSFDQPSQCSGIPNCGANTNCSSCSSNTNCGWCDIPATGGICRGAGYKSMCLSTGGGNIQWISNSTGNETNLVCPDVGNAQTCNSFSRCSTCSASSSDCGFCQSPSSVSCLPVNGSIGKEFCEQEWQGIWNDTTCPNYPNCYLSQQPPLGGYRQTCPQYNNSNCCIDTADTILGDQVNTRLAPIFGTGGCFANIKAMMCAWTCAPDSASYVSYEKAIFAGDYSNLTIYVHPDMAARVFESCKKVCIPFGSGVEVKDFFTGPEDFIPYLGSDSDPTYIANDTFPHLSYVVTSSRVSLSIQTGNASADDLIGCSLGFTKRPKNFGLSQFDLIRQSLAMSCFLVFLLLFIIFS